MNHDPQTLAPDPEFAAHLEWQVRTALRRAERFAAPTPRGRGRWVRSAALVLVSLALGAGGVLAADRLDEQRERGLRVERAELVLELARAREEALRAELGRLEVLHARGLLSTSELDGQRAAREHQRCEVRRLTLDAEETRAGGREPDDSLGAPLVHGRDFVLERLGLELERAQLELERLRGAAERAGLLVERGLVAESERADAAGALRERELGAGLVEQRVALRRRFLAGELSRERVELLGMRAAAEAALARADARLAGLEPRVARWEALVAAGRASGSDRELLDARDAARADRALAELELRLIDARLGR